MKRVIVVTGYASKVTLLKYSGQAMVGVEKGIEIAASAKQHVLYGICDFDSYRYEDALQYLKKENIVRLPKEKDISDTEAAIAMVVKLGYDEIVILTSLRGRYDHVHALLLLTKKFKNVRIYLEDDQNLITYYGKGSYILQRQDYPYLGLLGFPSAMVTLDNSLYPVKKMKIDFTSTHAISNQLRERVSVFQVLKGGVLVIQSRDGVEA